MTARLEVLSGGPGMTLQDHGRRGGLSVGLSRGGAMDRLALYEAAALFGEDAFPSLEMPMAGGRFQAVGGDLRVAMTGAELIAEIDGVRVPWWALHVVPDGAVLTIGAALGGVYGYLSVAGGFEASEVYGSASARPDWGIGSYIQAGMTLTPKRACNLPPRRLDQSVSRLDSDPIRVLAGPQTALFEQEVQVGFFGSAYRHGGRANRMGVGVVGGPKLTASGALSLVSDVVVPGDIQAVGAGDPYILLADCQTTGGYPRIGTVISADLERVAQRPPGAAFAFEHVDRVEALEARRVRKAWIAELPSRVVPLHRDPSSIANLRDFNLISGAISGEDED